MPTTQSHPPRGVSLLEATTLLLLLAAAAVVIVPLWQSDRIMENEEAAVRALRRIAAAQVTFLDRSQGRSFGFLEELAGSEFGRGLPVTPPLLPEVRCEGGIWRSQGYCFVVYLPANDGQGLYRPSTPDPHTAARFWVAFAWPSAHGLSGRQVFASDHQGRVWCVDNTTQPFSGPADVPPANLLGYKVKDSPMVPAAPWMAALRWQEVR